MKTIYVVTKEWPHQSLPPHRKEFDSMTMAFAHMILEASNAIRSQRVFDSRWLSDDVMALVSPEERILETYTMSMEEGECGKSNGTADDVATRGE